MACVVDYDFPAVIRAAKPKSGVERPVVCRIRGKSVLREVGELEAPVVAVIKRTDGRSKYRAIDGGLFVTVAHFSRLHQLNDRQRFLRRTGIEQRLFLEIAEAMSVYREAQIWPEGVKYGLEAVRLEAPMDHQPTERFRPYARDIGLLDRLPETDEVNWTGNTEADIAEALSRIDETLVRSVMVCDGKVICQTPEPCLAVCRDRTSTGGRIVSLEQDDVAFYGRRHHEPALHANVLDTYWADVEDVCFPLTEYAQARELAADMQSDFPDEPWKPAFVTDIEDVEVYDPSALTHDFRATEVTRLADRIFYHATKATRLPSRPKNFRKNVSEEFIETLLGFEAALDPDDGDLGQVEEALEAMLASVMEEGDHLRGLGIDTGAFTRALYRGLERWEGRPVEIAQFLGAGTRQTK